MNAPSLLNASVGSYRLIDFLGEGGMGEVYRAMNDQRGDVVAVKVLTKVDPRSSFVERFRNEAHIQSTLRHPNIARLFETGSIAGRPCIVMEYVDGETLDGRIRRLGRLPVNEALRIFHKVAEAVGYIHEQGIIHRDIKAGNVKISRAGVVKLLDFGIAKSDASPNLTRTGHFVGTLDYLAPEQLRGHAEPRSDIWALGVLLYEMLTGTVPFETDDVFRLFEKISKGDYTPASVFNPGVPSDVEAVIARCLRKRPADRFTTAYDLLAVLDRPTPSRLPLRLPTAVRPSRVHRGVRKARTGLRQLARRVAALAPAIPFRMAHDISTRTWAAAGAGAVLLVVLVVALASSGGDHQTLPQTYEQDTELSIRVDAAGVEAWVYDDEGRPLAKTPYDLKARPGQQFEFTLKREGYKDKPIHLEANERRSEYVFPMDKVDR